MTDGGPIRTAFRCVLSFLVLAALAPLTAAAADKAGPARGTPDEGETTREAIWKGFIVHLLEQGRVDLLPRIEEEAEAEEAEPESAEEHADHFHADVAPGKDPMLPILLRLSRELAALQAIVQPAVDPLGAAESKPSPEQTARVEAAIEALAGEKDPYVRAYADLFRARHELASERPREAVALIEDLPRSRHFLGHKEARRLTAGAFRALGDDTLAVLELRLFMLELADEDFTDRRWADEQLAEIRKEHEGPLHDSAEEARSASVLIAAGAVGKQTQEEQKRVEDILDRAIKLLGLPPEGACCENAAAGKPCGSGCESGHGKVALGEQRRVERILDGVIEVLEKSCGTCTGSCTSECSVCKKATACSKCGACKTCGQGQGLATGEGGHGQQGRQGRDGDPRGNRDPNGPAKDTKIRKGETPEAHVRDPGYDSTEIWGRINDAEVARSLKEVWAKIPVSYRRIVAQYYLDISDLAPEGR